MKNPILSIITVNLNNNDGLIKTLQSIKTQSYKNYEHIIIDADSSDGSKETIIHYCKETDNHLTYWVSEPDKGIFDGMNKGIAQAKGEYFYFLNSGDCLTNDVLKDIPLDGTQFIYGDMVLIEPTGRRDIIPPDHLNFYFFFYGALPHQASFIHRSLFVNEQYDTRYKIISDWAHSLKSILFGNSTYRHLSRVIAEFDGTGVSSSYIGCQTERVKWFQENLSQPFYSMIIEFLEYNKSEFKSIIPTMNRTRRFQKRALKLIKILLKLNSFLSRSKPKANNPYDSILYYP